MKKTLKEQKERITELIRFYDDEGNPTNQGDNDKGIKGDVVSKPDWDTAHAKADVLKKSMVDFVEFCLENEIPEEEVKAQLNAMVNDTFNTDGFEAEDLRTW